MSIALFLGCTIPARARNYEMSARMVADRFGLDLCDIEGFGCCGFPVKSTDFEFSQVMCARNLALAEQQGAEICVLCSACNASLAEANHRFLSEPETLRIANTHLAKVGLKYQGTVRIRHFARIMYEDVGLDAIRKAIVKPLDEFLIAPHLGCHYVKPSGAFGGFDDVENPRTLFELVEATGARVTRLGERKHCCGGAVLAYDPAVSFDMAEKKLNAVAAESADAICSICPFCTVMYDDNQKMIEKERDRSYGIPVMYYPQLLGLAMGLDPKPLGFKLNKIKTQPFLERLENRAEPAGDHAG